MLEKIKNLIFKIERKKISFELIFLSIISIAFIRNIIENILKSKNIYFGDDYITTIITYFFHFNFFWISIFLGLVIVLYLFTKKENNINSVLNISLFAFPIILFPPLFDFAIGNTDLMLYPNNPADLIYDTVNFLSFNKKLYGITIGMRIEIFTICLLFGFYIFIKNKKIFRSVLGLLISYFIIAFHGLWLSFFAQIYEIGLNFTDNFSIAESKLFSTGYVLRGSQSKISIIFISLTLIYLSIILYFKNKQIFKTLISQLRTSRLLHYFFLIFIGILVGKRIVLIEFFDDTTFNNFLQFKNPFEIIGIFISIVSMFLSFYSSVIFNDISDIHIDKISEPERPLPKNLISLKNYKKIGLFLLYISLSLAYCINISFFLILILINFVAYLYSNEPFRLKKYFLISNFSLGFIALFTFFLGTSVYLEQLFFKFIPFSISFILFISITIISQIKDIKDYTGDKQNGIYNILTLTSFNSGKYIIGIQILLVAFFIPLYFEFYDLLICSVLITAIITFLFIRKKNSENLLFSLYFIFLFWFFIRVINSNILITN